MSNESKRHAQYRSLVNNRERDLFWSPSAIAFPIVSRECDLFWSPSVLTFPIVSAVVIMLGLQGVAEAQPNLAAYFPLTVGNRWVYEASEGTSTEEWEVIREEEDAFVIQITADSLSTASFEEEFRPTPDGIERLTRSDINVDNRPQPAINRKFQPQPQAEPNGDAGPAFVLRRPLRIGTVWENGDGRYEITALGQAVTVPAGTFEDCVEVMHWSRGGKVIVISLYAPGVGVVQRDETFPLLEGSGNLNPNERQNLVLQLKEWTVH